MEHHGRVSLIDNSTGFIGMCDVLCKPLFLNDAGLRLVDWTICHKPWRRRSKRITFATIGSACMSRFCRTPCAKAMAKWKWGAL